MSCCDESRAKVLEYEAKQRLVEKEIELAKLQTAPPRKPLTDEQIAHATAPVFMGGEPSLTGIARAIEAAHGIKGEA